LTPWSLLLVAAGIRTLVLPFENVGGEPSTDWKGSAFEEAVASHFASSGQDVVDLEVRNRAFAKLGFTPGEPVSRATAIILGREVAASRLVVGAYRESEERLDVEARLIDLDEVFTLGIVEDFSAPTDLRRLSNQLAKNLFRLERDRAPGGFETHAERRAKLSMAALEASALARVNTDPEEQRRLFESALSREPDYLEARLELGRLLVRIGEPRRAIHVLVAAGEAMASYGKAYFDLGLAYLAIDEPGSALQIFANLATRGNGRAASYNNEGVALMELQRLTEAGEAFALAHDTDADDPTYLFNLGWSSWRAGKGALALEQLERARDRMPCDGEVHLLLSAAAASQAREEQSERARSTALVLSPQLSGVDPSVVTGWARAKDALRSMAPVEDADGTEEEDAVALQELFDAQWLRERGRLAEAVQLLQRSLYERPGAVEVRRELVALHREMGALDQAARELSMLLWTEPSVETHLELAKVYVELREPFKAFEQVQKALTLDPDDREARRLRDELSPPAI